mmetsp:Transcript_57732/g.137403  ORF Transcript_57732/g.137403 Transcript_57732/m.137403 type:complete len:787 (+) Transcript_57732:51-2411(+)
MMRRGSNESARESDDGCISDQDRMSYFPLGTVGHPHAQPAASWNVGMWPMDDFRPHFEPNPDETLDGRKFSVFAPPEESVRLQRTKMKAHRPTLWGNHVRRSAHRNGAHVGDSGSDEDKGVRRGRPRATLTKENFSKALDMEMFKEALLPFIAGSEPGSSRQEVYNTGFLRNAWKRAPTINVNFDHGAGQCVFSPDCKVMIVWDIIMMLAITWTIIITPYEIALLPSHSYTLLYACHLVVDYIFLFDLGVNCNLMFETSDDEGTYEVGDRAAILSTYLRGWFLWDLISAFPFTLLPNSTQKRFHGFQQMFRGCRLIRLFRISKLRRRNLLSRPIMPFWFRQVCILLGICFISVHLFACAWASLAACPSLDSFADYTWLDAVIKMKLDVPPSVKDSPFQVYTWSVYFAITLITTVGFGDVTPQSQLEVGVATIGICIGSIIWAYILSSLFTVLSRRDPHRTEFENMMDELKSMMEDHSLPGLLVFDVQNYFCECEKLWKLAKRRTHLIERMSPMLRGRVSLALCAEWIAKVGYIRDLFASGVPGTTGFVAEIASKLEASIFSAGEKLEALAIYIIRKGIVGQGSRVLSVGDVCGSDFMVHNPQNRNPFYPVSLTMTGTLLLTRRDFGYILKRFPPQAKSIRMYTLWLACKYGLARELRRAAARRTGVGEVGPASVGHFFGAVRMQGDTHVSPPQSPPRRLQRTSSTNFASGSTMGRTPSHPHIVRDGSKGAVMPELDDILAKLDYLTQQVDGVSRRLSRLDNIKEGPALISPREEDADEEGAVPKEQ